MADRADSPDKFYIAVRADLPAGLQLAQSVHAMGEFWDDHPSFARSWRRRSNFLVVVAVPNEETLMALATEASLGQNLCTTLVNEPDLGDEYTALAIQPGPQASVLCASFPLALRYAVDYEGAKAKEAAVG